MSRDKKGKHREDDASLIALKEAAMPIHVPVSLTYQLYSEEDFCDKTGKIPRFISIYDVKANAGKIALGSINSLRMSAPSYSGAHSNCQTCQQNYDKCQGHPGVMWLRGIKVFHPLCIRSLKFIMSCICTGKGKTKEPHPIISLETLRNTPEFYSLKGIERLELLTKQIKECELCANEGVQTKVIKYKITLYRSSVLIAKKDEKKKDETKEKKKDVEIIRKNDKYKVLKFEKGKGKLNEEDAYQVLKSFDELSDKKRKEYLEILGFNDTNRLSGFIMTHLIIMPPNLRGRQVFTESGAKPDGNNINTEYNQIIKLLAADDPMANASKLRAKITSLVITTIINNLLKGKKGLIRENSNSARCDFSARGVAILSAWLDMDQIGVPRAMSDHLTVKKKVVAKKLNKYKEMLGKEITSIFHKETPYRRIAITKDQKNKITLQEDDFVEVPMQNGDMVLGNRQPTIHSRSVMGHRAKIVPGSSVRVNMASTSGYHLDFDGDEINLHIPQVLQAIYQAKTIGNIKYLISNPHNGGNMTGLVYELLDAATRLTSGNFIVTREQFKRIALITFREEPIPFTFDEVMSNEVKSLPKSKQYITGHALFSLALPQRKGFNFVKDDVIIIDGRLMKGQITKAMIGVPGHIVTAIYNNYGENGPNNCADFLNKGNRLLLAWQDIHPTTFRVKDYMINIEKIVKEQKANVELRDIIRKTVGRSDSGNDDDKPRLDEKWEGYKAEAPEVVWHAERLEIEKRITMKLLEFDPNDILEKREFSKGKQELYDALLKEVNKVTGIDTDKQTIIDYVNGNSNISIESFNSAYKKATACSFLSYCYETMHETTVVKAKISHILTLINSFIWKYWILDPRPCFMLDTKGEMKQVLFFPKQEIQRLLRYKVFDVIDTKEYREWIDMYRLQGYMQGLNDFAPTQLKNLPSDSFLRMAKVAGSKGSEGHGKMEIFCGQQLLRSKLLGVASGERRCLPYFRDTLDPRSRGFIESSLMQGVSPAESFIMHIVGRETNIEAANNAPKAGYGHRQAAMCFLNIITGNDLQLLFGMKLLLQSVYGGDGLDPNKTVMSRGIYSFVDIEGIAKTINAAAGYA